MYDCWSTVALTVWGVLMFAVGTLSGYLSSREKVEKEKYEKEKYKEKYERLLNHSSEKNYYRL